MNSVSVAIVVVGILIAYVAAVLSVMKSDDRVESNPTVKTFVVRAHAVLATVSASVTAGGAISALDVSTPAKWCFVGGFSLATILIGLLLISASKRVHPASQGGSE